MADQQFVELVLTCSSWQQAQLISDALLAQKLVACVEQFEVKSKHWWEGQLEEAKEIKLIMQTIANHFEKIEAEIAKLHSYDTFVLQQLPLTNLSAKTNTWLREIVK